LNYGNIRRPHADFSTDAGRGLVRGQPGLHLREDRMGKWRDRAEALHAGNRTRTAKALATDGTPSLMLEDKRSTSAHRNWGDQPDSHRNKRLHGA